VEELALEDQADFIGGLSSTLAEWGCHGTLDDALAAWTMIEVDAEIAEIVRSLRRGGLRGADRGPAGLKRTVPRPSRRPMRVFRVDRDVYKVHHHGSRYSTNTAWLQVVNPRIGIVSTGTGNSYNHPTEECIERLHNAGVIAYWTESGNGVAPEDGVDVVGGTIIVEVPTQATSYTVRHTAGAATVDQFDTDWS
jgi:hypothetical protein